MANVREIVNRRESVNNIHKITKTMEMIATSRFKKAHDAALGSKAYSEGIAGLAAALAGGSAQVDHPLLRANNGSGRTMLLVLTSNRGLCGGYNSNVMSRARKEIARLTEAGQEIELRVSGKKGIGQFKFLQESMAQKYADFDEKIPDSRLRELADEFMDLYCRREVDAVQVVYMKFVSTAKYYANTLAVLPLGGVERESGEPTTNLDEYIFSPDAQEILAELLPETVRIMIVQCFRDAAAGEQAARMQAMKAATDNADQMITDLTKKLNRARRTQITSELLDIQGGVEALA